jgi:hypothetical protein
MKNFSALKETISEIESNIKSLGGIRDEVQNLQEGDWTEQDILQKELLYLQGEFTKLVGIVKH